jgi:hypothetical protein
MSNSATLTWHATMASPRWPRLSPRSCLTTSQAKENIPPSLFARKDEIWPATVKSYKSNKSLTLCHSDPHLSNWFRHKDTGKMAVQGGPVIPEISTC